MGITKSLLGSVLFLIYYIDDFDKDMISKVVKVYENCLETLQKMEINKVCKEINRQISQMVIKLKENI